MITIFLKKEYKYIFLLFASVFSVQSVVTQDIIKLQYNDSICGKVINVSQKEIVYQSQTFYDSGQYSIDRKKVIEIKYADGKTVPISKNSLDIFYRPSINFIIGTYGGDSEGDDYYLSTISLGFGHRGTFRLPLNGFGIVYNAEALYGRYSYDKTYDSLSQHSSSGPFYALNFSLGIEYRYSIFRGLALYGDFQAGKSYLNFCKEPLYFYSNDLVYSISSGIYMNHMQLGIKYFWGQLMRQSKPETGEIMQLINHYQLAEMQFFVSYAF